MSEVLCEICGEPMPPNEQMFKFHGYSGACPKPPLPRPRDKEKIIAELKDAVRCDCIERSKALCDELDALK